METLIVYASATGNTEKCAGILGQRIKNTTIINLMGQQDIDISKYDVIIIGSPIRMGMLHKRIKKFISKNKESLTNKNVAYYICCGFPDNYKKYFEENIPKDLLEKAVIYDTFGGEISDKGQTLIDRFIINIVSKVEKDREQPKILNKNIEDFASIINNKFGVAKNE